MRASICLRSGRRLLSGGRCCTTRIRGTLPSSCVHAWRLPSQLKRRRRRSRRWTRKGNVCLPVKHASLSFGIDCCRRRRSCCCCIVHRTVTTDHGTARDSFLMESVAPVALSLFSTGLPVIRRTVRGCAQHPSIHRPADQAAGTEKKEK